MTDKPVTTCVVSIYEVPFLAHCADHEGQWRRIGDNGPLLNALAAAIS
ncbi:hypothetical protein [Mesorhizobium sp.]|nr:hypothetical protein [Mesorhizobium sp.]